jgi:hypothetical protein
VEANARSRSHSRAAAFISRAGESRFLQIDIVDDVSHASNGGGADAETLGQRFERAGRAVMAEFARVHVEGISRPPR